MEDNRNTNPALDSKDMNITYETIFETLRIEKNRDDLQQLPLTFFDEVIAYLREKQQILDESKIKEDIFSATERDKVSNELSNIKRILSELYERREKKIINMALNKSRTRSNIIDTSNLLENERLLFNRFVSTMDSFREGIITNVLNLRTPFVNEVFTPIPAAGSVKSEGGKEPSSVQKDSKLLRFLNPVPKFIGKELETYGPFEEEDMATLPCEIADVLVSKGRAEEITEG